MSKYAILSDIHGNLYALLEVMKDLNNHDIKGIFLLGDLIDYGMQSNEVVEYFKDNFDGNILCNIWGNHEKAILTSDYSNFSSIRGVESAKYTNSHLNQNVKNYLNRELIKQGYFEFEIGGKKILAIHGSLLDPFWRAIFPENVNGDYSSYDIVISGHSHYSHYFQKFYNADDVEMRNKKIVHFINPGSVGQPRNHNPNAQYAIIDIKDMSVSLNAVNYPRKKAMDLYDGSVDDFYRKRLEKGI